MTSAVLLLRDFPVLLRSAPERPRYFFFFLALASALVDACTWYALK